MEMINDKKEKDLVHNIVNAISKDCSFKDFADGKELKPQKEIAKGNIRQFLEPHLTKAVFKRLKNK